MKRALSFLGLLNRGGKLRFGMGVEKSLPKAKAAILADDASANSKKASLSSLPESCSLLQGVNKADLGQALGYDEISMVLVMDGKAAKSLREKWEKGD